MPREFELAALLAMSVGLPRDGIAQEPIASEDVNLDLLSSGRTGVVTPASAVASNLPPLHR